MTKKEQDHLYYLKHKDRIKSQVKEWQLANKDKRKKHVKKYNSSEKAKKLHIKQFYVDRDRFPEKNKAREKVHQEVRAGRLLKQPCKVCNNPIVHAHHTDYSKPLDVIWLCSPHHREIHTL